MTDPSLLQTLATPRPRKSPHRYLRSLWILLLVSVFLPGCDQQLDLTEDEYLNRATFFEAQNDITSAIIEYKNALRINPKNFDARWSVGKLRLKQKKWSLAENHLQYAATLDPNNRKLRIDLAQAILPQGKFDEVLSLFEFSDKKLTPYDTVPLIMRGKALLGLLRTDEAKEAFEKALKLQPQNPDAQLGLAQIALETNEWDKADTLITIVLATFPEHIDALMLQGDLYRLRGETRKAISTYTRVLTLDPRNISAHLSRAKVFLLEGKFDAVILDIDMLRKYVPDYPVSNYLEALASFGKNDYDAAEDSVRQVLKAAPNHPPSLLLLATLQYKKGAIEGAVANLNLYLDSKPNNLYARKLMAEAQLKLGHPDAAIQALSLNPEQLDKDYEAAAILGNAYLQAGDPDKATRILQTAVDNNPKNPRLQTSLGLIQATTNQHDKAIETLETAAKLGADSIGINTILTFYHLKNGDFDQAMAKADEIREKQPTSPLGYYLKGLTQIAQGKSKEARRYIELSLQVQEDFIPSIIVLAQMEVDAGNPDALTQRLSGALKKNEKNTEILEQLARASERKAELQQAIDYWKRLNAINPEYAQAYLSLTRDYLRINETRKAVAIAMQGRSALPKDLSLLNALGIAQLYDQQIDAAIETFSRLKGLQPAIIDHYLQLAQAQIAAGKTITARETLQNALKQEPNHLSTMKMLAKLELDDGHPDRARDIITQISQSYPDDPEGIILLGKTYLSIQEYGKAGEAFLKGYQTHGSKPFLIALFNTYQLDNKQAQGIALLQDWLSKNPKDLHARALLSDSLMASGDNDEALSQYQKVIDKRPESAETHNNIAWLLLKNGDNKALYHAEEAVRLKPDSIAFNDTLGWVLLHVDQAEKGLHILQETVKKAPQLNEVRYHLAVAHQLNGQQAQAIEELERALLDGGFEGEQQARKLLEKLSHSDSATPQP